MHLIHDDAGGNGCVEGLYTSGHRQGQDEVTLLPDQPAHSFALVPDDQRHRTREVRLTPGLAFHVGAVDPDAPLFQFFHARGEIGDPGDRQVLERTGRGLVHRVVEGGTAALRDDDPVGAGTFGGADDGSEIVRVGDLIGNDEEGGFALFLRAGEQVVQRRVLVGRHLGDDALVVGVAAHEPELFRVRLLDEHTGVPGRRDDLPDGPLPLAFGDENGVDVPSGFQSFHDRISADDELVANFLLFHARLTLLHS